MIPQPIDQVPLFLRLSEEERELVTARLRRRQAASGELIFTEGHPSDAMFVITAGRVKLEGGSVDSTLTLANLGAGSLLGEEDMLLDRPYSTSARAAATTQLHVLSRTDLEDLVGQHPAIGLKFSAALGLRIPFLDQYLIHQRLRNTELLTALSEDDLRAIADRLDFRTAARGDLVIEAGAPGEMAFFIEEGKARMISPSREGDSFDELSEGALFGHTALITGKPYSATVRAVTDLTLWALPRDAYQELIADHPAIKLAFSRALAESLSASDQTEAMERMRQLQLFSDVPTDALTALASRLVLRHFPTGEAIYTEGTPGDAMYVVESGEIRLMDTAFSDAHLLERMRAGDSFGEMALLTGRTRAECARAATDSTLWVLYKSDFDDVMVQYPEISVSLSRALTERLSTRENDFVVRHLRRIELFSNLATSELQSVSKKVRGLRFRPGEIIYFAGQPAETLFMIEMGEIKRMTAGPNGEPTMLDILGPGDSMGVQSIVQNSPYAETAQAIGDIEIWTIAKSDFQSMMETFPALAITITRLMADQLMRSQQFPQPPMHGQPRGARSVPLPTRGPSGTPRAARGTPITPRPTPVVPQPAPRIQQPRSGARPIKPNTQKPIAPATPTPVPPATNANLTPNVPSKPLPRTGAHLPHVPAPHLPHVDPPNIPTPHLPHFDKPQLPHMQTPHIAAPHLPHVPAPHLQAPRVPNVRKDANRFSTEFGIWVRNLSWGARLRVLATGALLMWLIFVAFPITTLTTVSSAVAGLQLSNQPPTTDQSVQLVRQPATGNGPVKVAYAVSTATPFPTRTPRPTSTPRPKPTAAAVRRAAPVPAPVIAAAPTATPAPTLPPIEWDARLGPASDPIANPDLQQVRIIPANVGHGQKFWRAIKVQYQGAGQSGNDHSIYVMLLDQNGQRTTANLKAWGDGSGPVNNLVQKEANDPCNCNYGIGMWGDGYNVQVDDQYPSETVAGMCMCGIPNILKGHDHVNFRVTFELVTNP